jgi:segregation and condensation protein B
MSYPIEKLKKIIEGALLAAGEPLNADRILSLFSEIEEKLPTAADIKKAIEALQADCEGRGFELKEVASGYRFQVRQDLSRWVSRLWDEKPQRYTRSLLETLALIAYRQPITRAEIEEIRGVAVNTQTIRTLQEREWVRIVGHRDVPGRPAMFATTRGFLDYFNLKNLDDLPTLSDIRDLDKINQELNLDQFIDDAKAEAIAEREMASDIDDLDEEVN